MLIIISVRWREEKDAEVRKGITGCINDGYKQICKRDVSEERTPCPHTHTHKQSVYCVASNVD